MVASKGMGLSLHQVLYDKESKLLSRTFAEFRFNLTDVTIVMLTAKSILSII